MVHFGYLLMYEKCQTQDLQKSEPSVLDLLQLEMSLKNNFYSKLTDLKTGVT